MKKYEKLSKDIVEAVGGKENVISLHHCVTRLRFKLKSNDKADIERLKKMDGVATALISGEQFQVVIGNHVADVFDEVLPLLGLSGNEKKEEPKREIKSIKDVLNILIDVLSKLFQPILGTMAAAGMLKGIAAILLSLGVLNTDGTYLAIQAAGDGLFQLLPVFLAWTSANYFGMNGFTAIAIAAGLIYPSLGTMELFNKAHFLGLPVVIPAGGYVSTVMPIIFSVWLGSHVEKLFKKIIPAMVRTFLVPFFTLLITYVLSLLIIGPIISSASTALGTGLTALYNLNSTIAGGLLAGIWMIMVMFGLHWGLIPIAMNNIATLGYDTIIGSLMAHSFALLGVLLVIILKTKEQKVKDLSIPAAFSALFGVTEPGIYGVALPMKKPFIIACISSAIGGAIGGFFKMKIFVIGPLGIFSLSAYIPKEGIGRDFYIYSIVCLISLIAGIVLTMFIKIPKLYGEENVTQKNDKKQENENSVNIENKIMEKEIVYSPLKGEVKLLEEAEDEAFASGALGKGAAVVPVEGKIMAPVDGTIVTLFPTNHAIAIETNSGVEILIHVGLDTVQLDGKYFYPKVKEGDKIKKGDLILEFDIDEIKKAGYVLTTPIIVTNTDEYLDILEMKKENVEFGDELITIVK